MPRTMICVGIGTSNEMPSRGVMRTVCEYPRTRGFVPASAAR
jgi:hypothetical protein